MGKKPDIPMVVREIVVKKHIKGKGYKAIKREMTETGHSDILSLSDIRWIIKVGQI